MKTKRITSRVFNSCMASADKNVSSVVRCRVIFKILEDVKQFTLYSDLLYFDMFELNGQKW